VSSSFEETKIKNNLIKDQGNRKIAYYHHYFRDDRPKGLLLAPNFF